MIRVTVELVPWGDETQKRTIATADITNVGGDDAWGEYRAEFHGETPGPRPMARTFVKRFARKQENVWRLIHEALFQWGGR